MSNWQGTGVHVDRQPDELAGTGPKNVSVQLNAQGRYVFVEGEGVIGDAIVVSAPTGGSPGRVVLMDDDAHDDERRPFLLGATRVLL